MWKLLEITKEDNENLFSKTKHYLTTKQPNSLDILSQSS